MLFPQWYESRRLRQELMFAASLGHVRSLPSIYDRLDREDREPWRCGATSREECPCAPRLPERSQFPRRIS